MPDERKEFPCCAARGVVWSGVSGSCWMECAMLAVLLVWMVFVISFHLHFHLSQFCVSFLRMRNLVAFLPDGWTRVSLAPQSPFFDSYIC